MVSSQLIMQKVPFMAAAKRIQCADIPEALNQLIEYLENEGTLDVVNQYCQVLEDIQKLLPKDFVFSIIEIMLFDQGKTQNTKLTKRAFIYDVSTIYAYILSRDGIANLIEDLHRAEAAACIPRTAVPVLSEDRLKTAFNVNFASEFH